MKSILKEIIKGNYSALGTKIFSEKKLKELAVLILNIKERELLLTKIILSIPKNNYAYDWNCGSLVQHFDSSLVTKIFLSIGSSKFYESVGLTWAFGELNSKDPIIINYLYEAIKNSNNHESWWRAAFSLEKLGLEQAVNCLKINLEKRREYSLEHCLENLHDKKCIIGLLLCSDSDNIKNIILPTIEEKLLISNDTKTIVNCCWLIGRFKFIDTKIFDRLRELVIGGNYELQYYAMLAITENAAEKFKKLLEKFLSHHDPLIRKMAVRGVSNIANFNSMEILEKRLVKEKNEKVIGELTKAIYSFKNPEFRRISLLRKTSTWNENGTIRDDSDKWYSDPALYQIFSESEDPENICFNIIQNAVKNIKIVNPVDIASGTGRMAWQILDHLDFEGCIYCVDSSKKMCDFLELHTKRDNRSANKLVVENITIKDLVSSFKNIKTSFVISSFGFPSKISNKNLVFEELKAIYSILSDNGHFFSMGWDETFNDELNEMWFKYIPDSIDANNFEEWRRIRSASIDSPRNCNLTWLKKGIMAPLQFSSIEESANVMGHLFGKEALEYIIKTNKTSWSMSLGITHNTKKELGKILKNLK